MEFRAKAASFYLSDHTTFTLDEQLAILDELDDDVLDKKVGECSDEELGEVLIWNVFNDYSVAHVIEFIDELETEFQLVYNKGLEFKQ